MALKTSFSLNKALVPELDEINGVDDNNNFVPKSCEKTLIALLVF